MDDREALLNRVQEKASHCMQKYGGCGQCTLLALHEEFGLPGGPAVVKAAGFTNLGIATMGMTCGALLGAVMAIGLACGREDLADPIYPRPEETEDEYDLPRSQMLIRGFCQDFVRAFGSGSCSDLQIRLFGRNYDVRVLEEEEKFRLAGGHLRCVEMVGKTARMAAEVILRLPRR